MYRILLINGEEKRVIYHPLSSSTYIQSAFLDQEVNVFSTLSLEILGGQELTLEEYKSIIEVYEEATNRLVFRGRVMTKEKDMQSDGLCIYYVEAEDGLSYLNDASTREFKLDNTTLLKALNHIIARYNALGQYTFKITNTTDKTIKEEDENISFISCYEALQRILELTEKEIEVIHKDNKVIEISLKDSIGSNRGVQVRLGQNILDTIVQTGARELVTRVVPIWRDSDNVITISSINNGKDYIADTNLEKSLGVVVERIVENDDEKITKTKLKSWGEKELKKLAKLDYTITANVLDLEFLSGSKASIFLADTVNVYNPLVNVYSNSKVYGISTNLLEPYNPQIQFNTRKRGLVDKIIDLTSKSKNKSSIYSTIYNIVDNITKSKPVTDTVVINKISNMKASHLYVTLDKYTIYTDEGETVGTYPNTVKIYVNNVLVHTMAGGTEEEATITITEQLKEGTNKIKFTASTNGRINAKLELSNVG